MADKWKKEYERARRARANLHARKLPTGMLDGGDGLVVTPGNWPAKPDDAR